MIYIKKAMKYIVWLKSTFSEGWKNIKKQVWLNIFYPLDHLDYPEQSHADH